jgi:hypothetical protein
MSDSLASQLEALIRRVDPKLEILLPYLKVYDLLLNLKAAEEIEELCAKRSPDGLCGHHGTGEFAS